MVVTARVFAWLLWMPCEGFEDATPVIPSSIPGAVTGLSRRELRCGGTDGVRSNGLTPWSNTSVLRDSAVAKHSARNPTAVCSVRTVSCRLCAASLVRLEGVRLEGVRLDRQTLRQLRVGLHTAVDRDSQR